MAQDFTKVSGTTRAFTPDAGNANSRIAPVFGIVKDNVDPTRSGRIRVFISDFSGLDPDNYLSWTTVSPLSSFYGHVEATAANTGTGSYVSNPSSYGMWTSPPDVGTTVVCIFINGDMNYGYYIGCVYKPEAMTSIPTVAGGANVVVNRGEAASLGGSEVLPVTNMNTNNQNDANSSDFLNVAKPVHSYMAAIMSEQGIVRDPVRGPITSSSQRETPSNVGWGVSTPGRPIYAGGANDVTAANASVATGQNKEALEKYKVIARRTGHSFVMDDGDEVGKNQVVRIRTALGHQILMSDDGATLMLLHANGKTYIELGKEGTVDVYAMNSVNIRTQGDLNLHADRDINIQALKKLNIKAEDINIESVRGMNKKIGTDYKAYAKGTYSVKADTNLALASNGDAAFMSDNKLFMNGTKINLNSGSPGITPKTVPAIPVQNHTDSLFDSTVGWAAAPGKLLSIVSRAPAHYPWANAGEGVDVKVDTNSDAVLPTNPSPAVSAINTAANNTNSSGGTFTLPGVAAIPSIEGVSQAVDKNCAAGMVASVAANTASIVNTYPQNVGGVLEKIPTAGGNGSTVSSAVPRVGTLAQTPTQLEDAGILKPGSAVRVSGYIQTELARDPANSLNILNNISVESVMPPSVFTGQPGAENLQAYCNNMQAQIDGQVANYQKTQTCLTQAGVITGKESSASIAGLIQGANWNTRTNVAGSVSRIAEGIKNAQNIGNQLSILLNPTLEQGIKAGLYAARVGQEVMGGMGSISKAMTALTTNLSKVANPNSPITNTLFNSERGAVAAAFTAITQSFTPLRAGIPQNLKQISKDINAARSAVDAATAGVNIAGKTIRNMTNGTTIVNNLGGSAAIASSIASGVSAIPGGQAAISTVAAPFKSAMAKLPGLENIKTIASAVSSLTRAGTSLTADNIKTSILYSAGNTITSGEAANLAGAFSSISSGSLPLTQASMQGLQASTQAILGAAISSTSCVGPDPSQIPEIGFGTVNIEAEVAQMASILEDNRIPVPNIEGEPIDDAASSLIDSLQESTMNRVEETQNYLETVLTAKQAYLDALNNEPAGSNAINAARDAWLATERTYQDKLNNIETLQDFVGSRDW